MIPFLLLFLSLAFYSISQNWAFGSLKWMSDDPYGFWGEDSDKRKWKRRLVTPDDAQKRKPFARYAFHTAEQNWYTKLLGITRQERWLTSTNFTIAFTDGYHLCQGISHVLLAWSYGMLTSWWIGILVWVGIKGVHWIVLKQTQIKHEDKS